MRRPALQTPTPSGFVVPAGRAPHDAQEILSLEVNSVSYTDRTLTCVDCSVEFIHSAADQEFYAEKGFVSDPKRCPSCRAARRAMRESSGYDSRDIGGPRGYERGEYLSLIHISEPTRQ